MSEAILTQKNYVFNDAKRTLLRQKNMDVYWGTGQLCILCGTWIVWSSSLRAPMMFLFRWAKWTTDYTDSSFPVCQFEFPSRLIFIPSIGRSVIQHSCSKKRFEYRPASDRSFLRIERAYFTQLSLCFDNSDDVFGIMVFDELVKKFELKVRVRGWIILLIRKVE